MSEYVAALEKMEQASDDYEPVTLDRHENDAILEYIVQLETTENRFEWTLMLGAMGFAVAVLLYMFINAAAAD